MLTVENIFDKAAKDYDKTEGARFAEYSNITLENTRQYLKHDDVILDFGCATGTKAISMSKEVKNIIAIDISSKMISLAQQKANEKNIENIQFLQASVFDENLTLDSFDAVLVFNIIHLLDNEISTLERIAKLLKPGGLLISTTPCLNEKMKLDQKLKFLLFRFLMWLKLLPNIKCYKFSDLINLMYINDFHIIEAKKYALELSSYFIVAQKNKDR